MFSYYFDKIEQSGKFKFKSPTDFKDIVVPLSGQVNDVTVSLYSIAQSVGNGDIASLLNKYLNGRGGELSGLEVGMLLRNTHRTLQRLAIVFALGLLYGISKQEHSDLRNGEALKAAKKIAKMLDDGELGVGGYL